MKLLESFVIIEGRYEMFAMRKTSTMTVVLRSVVGTSMASRAFTSFECAVVSRNAKRSSMQKMID